MTGSALGNMAPVGYLILGVASAFIARYLVGALLAGGVAYLAVRVVLPIGSPKYHALKGVSNAVFDLARSAMSFARVFVAGIQLVPVAAFLVGAMVGFLLLSRWTRWS